MYPLGCCSASASTPPPRSPCSPRPAPPPPAAAVYAILCLPILFAAGMSLLDTIDGAFMNFAYGWAFSKPVRKIYYNLTITALSVAVALIIGTIELLAVFADKLSLTGGIWDFVSGLDLNLVGYVIVGLFVVTWVLAFAVWRFGRIEEQWTAGSTRASRAGVAQPGPRRRQAVTRRSTCRVTRMRRAVLAALAVLRREHAVLAAREVGDAPAHREAAVPVEHGAREHHVVHGEHDARLAELDLGPAGAAHDDARPRPCRTRVSA